MFFIYRAQKERRNHYMVPPCRHILLVFLLTCGQQAAPYHTEKNMPSGGGSQLKRVCNTKPEEKKDLGGRTHERDASTPSLLHTTWCATDHSPATSARNRACHRRNQQATSPASTTAISGASPAIFSSASAAAMAAPSTLGTVTVSTPASMAALTPPTAASPGK